MCLDSGPWSADLPGHRGRPPLRGVFQTSSPDAAAGGDDTQAGLGSNVSHALVNGGKTQCSKQRRIITLVQSVRPSVTHDISDTGAQMLKTL